MRRLKYFAVPLVLIGFLPSIGISQGLVVGKYAGEFLSTGGGARALGMGGAYVALANDASSVYWNAAGLAKVAYPQVLFMHSSRFSGIVKYDFAAAAIPYGKNAGLGIGIIRVGIDDIPHTELMNPKLGLGETYYDEGGKKVRNVARIAYNFSDTEYGFFISYGKSKSSTFAYGGAVKIVHKFFDKNSAWGIGFDISARYQAKSYLILAANFQDITTTLLAWDTGRKELIVPTLKVGAAFPLALTIFAGTLAPAVDLDIRFENRHEASQLALGRTSADIHAGFEYEYRNRFALRLGSDAGYFSAGAGLKLPKLAVDYAFMSHSVLGATHRISVQLTIQEERFRRK